MSASECLHGLQWPSDCIPHQVGCSVIAYDYRDVGRSRGLLLGASGMVDDGARCVRYCEGKLAVGSDPSRCILLLGQVTAHIAIECDSLRLIATIATACD